MLIFVDYEHPDQYLDGKGQRMQAARTWITYRLEDLADMPCMLVRWNRITPELLDQVDARALFISGNSAHPSQYSADDSEPLFEIIRSTALPMFGFCGGLQGIGRAFGAQLERIAVTADQIESSELLTEHNGNAAEFGYHPVELVAAHALLDGIDETSAFRHAHQWHIPELPTSFRTLARTEATPIQIAVDDQRRVVGTQFHPEYWTDEHPAGKTLIENFLRWIELI